MLHCNVIVTVTNKGKASFHFIHIILTKEISESHFNYSGLNVSIKNVNNQ